MKDFRKRLALAIFVTASFFIYKTLDPGWLIDWEIDKTTYVFFSLIPAILLLKASSKANTFIAVIFLVFMAYFSLNKYELTAENFAIMAFLLFSLAVIQQMIIYMSSEKPI